MTRLSIIFSLLTLMILIGCVDQPKRLHVLFENGDGVEVGDLVLQNDKQVGVVSEVNLTDDYEVLTNLQFQDSMPPKGSTFKVKHLNILGDRAIEMSKGRSSFKLKPGETVLGEAISQPKSETRTISSLLEKIRMLLSQEENDSLMREIQGLKAKVDSLEHVRNNIDSTRQSLPDSFPQSSGT
jgi:ABC-type transporter Mla subunit MlaD